MEADLCPEDLGMTGLWVPNGGGTPRAADGQTLPEGGWCPGPPPAPGDS